MTRNSNHDNGAGQRFRKSTRMGRLRDYESLVGAETIERIRRKARLLADRHIVHVSSTYYGGGVAAYLSSLALLMNDVRISTGWRVIQGNPSFFSITKGMHNALQGGEMELTDEAKAIYEDVNHENSIKMHIDHDFVIVHDPQPLPLIQYYTHSMPWIWRCHIDLSNPDRVLWNYLRRFIDQHNAVIVSIPEYAQEIMPPQVFHMPAIDPFSLTNKELSDDDIDKCLARYPQIPTDLPLVVQVSRFDKWKDPQGVIEAFKIARREVDCTLVLIGSAATDDPEGEEVYRSLLDQQEERVIMINREDSLLVNSLQRRAAVILQKSLREGFGLTVSEAMWKGTPVIGGNVGGIRYQIEDKVSGFLVSSVEQAAQSIIQLVKDKDMRDRMGRAARETVRKKFLMTRLLEQYLDLLNSFEIVIRLDHRRVRRLRASPLAP